MKIERKVSSATGNGAITAVIMFMLENYFFEGNVPVIIVAIVPVIAAAISGYMAPHTNRTAEESGTVG